jgi:pimeloyl-ACP methyl ester carboxylesterase
MESFENDGLRFDVTDLGPADGPVVVLLHGFPADRHCWRAVAGELAAAGYRTLAPDQRGYGPRSRPAGRRAYSIDVLGDDVLALADQAGVDRFALVGHDWGAAVAWHLAATAPDRLASLTAVSVPHPRAMLRAAARSDQALRSWYVAALQLPVLPERVLAWHGGALLRRGLRSSGLDAAAVERYSARAADPAAMAGPIGWYRAIPFAPRRRPEPVTVATMMIWSAGDTFVSRAAAEGAAAWVDAPYRFVEIPDGTHWLPEDAPAAVAAATIQHLRAHPARADRTPS